MFNDDNNTTLPSKIAQDAARHNLKEDDPVWLLVLAVLNTSPSEGDEQL